jgi:PhnB protein
MSNNHATSVKPFLNVNNGAKAVEFYIAAFGAIETKRFDMPNQKISSVVQIEGAEFYVADEEPENGNLSPAPGSPNPVRIILYSLKADEFYNKALSLGAQGICPMTTEEDWRIGKLKDPFGHVWEIGYTL